MRTWFRRVGHSARCMMAFGLASIVSMTAFAQVPPPTASSSADGQTAQAPAPSSQAAQARPAAPSSGPTDESSISHLPENIQKDITAWRERLANAKCIKIVCESDEIWAHLHDLDARGDPKVIAREHLSVHSWMMPDALWLVIFPYKGDEVDTAHPVFQEYWSAASHRVWDRAWVPETASYKARRWECTEVGGPSTTGFETARGCMWGSVINSWLAGGGRLSERPGCTRSIGLLRKPNLAMVPPDPSQHGVWLDVFKDRCDRNEDHTPNSVYRRQDFMLLARNEAGEPEVREWRTLVLTDPHAGGKKPSQITGVNRFSYTFYDAEPAELKAAVEKFSSDVDRVVGR